MSIEQPKEVGFGHHHARGVRAELIPHDQHRERADAARWKATVIALLSFPILLGSKRVVSPQSGQQPLRRAFTNISTFSTNGK